MAHKPSQAFALLGTCALVALSACGSEAPGAASHSDTSPANPTADIAAPSEPTASAPDSATEEEHVGAIALSLKLGEQRLDSLGYAIVGSGFSKSGSLDVSHSSKVSGVIGGIPFANDYALTMTGKGAGATPLDCSGSTSFDLKEVGPLPVTIQITCKEPTTVVEPPPASMPAPVPPFAIFTLAGVLAALGIFSQRRAHSR